MATRKFTRAYGDEATSDFEKMDGTAAELDNVSGRLSPNTVRFPRDGSAVAASSPGPAPGHRVAMLITATTGGPDLGNLVEHALATAARHAIARRTAGQSTTAPLDQEYLDTVLGADVKRGRAETS